MGTCACIIVPRLLSGEWRLQGILGAKPQFGSSRKGSFIVNAASTPPLSLPGDYGFDPLGLSDPEGTGGFIEPKWLAYGEIINGRYAMFQDWSNSGSMGKQYFLGFKKYLGGSGEPAYPGGLLFNPLGFGKDDKSLKDLKLKR
ncbi:hypothetical protein F3Y22_tig00111621pilonHSYRG00503 [Hibiscus syriacus]|uniref:Chlorophyll a-b binding protein, chloroplastic n=1 Tax=Hibiscus syriacus TaxID=106335 RepID=A0A6A2Y5F8_HIBSY|nr:hypothetical protein F3Y22_tig00111621pilonHSYRG00503 [Hibiscus syriacus]